MKKILKSFMFLFIILIGGISLAACSNGGKDAMAKEDDAIMFQAISAAALTQAGPAIKADEANLKAELPELPGEGVEVNVDITDSIKAEIEAEIQKLFNEYSKELLKLRDIIKDLHFDHKESTLEGYTHLTSYVTKDFDGNTYTIEFHYNNLADGKVLEEDEDEIEYEFKGVLIVKRNDEEVLREEVSGKVEIEDGETVTKLVHENELGKVTIESKIENGKRVFEYEVELGSSKYEFELSVEEIKNGTKLELETSLEIEKGIKADLELEIKALNNKALELEVEVDVEMGTLKTHADLEVILTQLSPTAAEAKVKGSFKVEGKAGEVEVEKEGEVGFKIEINLGETEPVLPVDPETEG